MHIYTAWNSAMATTAAQVSVTTGTVIKTMLQIATPASRKLQIVSWGWSSDDPPGADGVIELIETDVAATVTAHSASGVQPEDSSDPASLVTLGTAATGFTSTAEGSITATRLFDVNSLSSVSGESRLEGGKEWLPRRGPIIPVSKFLRVRATTPTTAIDMRCWIKWEGC
jgi:hypothetical protein